MQLVIIELSKFSFKNLSQIQTVFKNVNEINDGGEHGWITEKTGTDYSVSEFLTQKLSNSNIEKRRRASSVSKTKSIELILNLFMLI